MSNGRTHFRYGLYVTAGATSVAFLAALSKEPLAALSGVGLLAGAVVGLIITPDTDLKHNYSRYRLRRRFPIFGSLVWLWFLPFALGRHRGISHTTWGTLMRWVWAWWIPLAVAVAFIAPLLPYVFLFLLAALLGQGAQDTVHLLKDR